MSQKARIFAKNIEEYINVLFPKKNKELDNFFKSIYFEDNKYFLIDAKAKKLKENISRSVFSAGLFMGEIKKQEFIPSLALIDKLSTFSENKVFVDKKAEWLFLCGRDIFEKSVHDSEGERGIVFVQNLKDENLGLGKFEKKEVTNIIDKGYYLRKEN
ncbi:MAG: hypothetical protein ACLFPQ_01355 [Candidatus Woesearchaeota archaeon]